MGDENGVGGNDSKLKRDIGLWAAGFLVLNGVIGAGIFGLPGRMAEQTGIFSPWLIIIFGTLMLTVVWTFASLASYFSETGGPVAYANRAFGPLIGFQTGWLLYISRAAATAANINVLFNYTAYLWDGASGELTRGIVFFIIIGTLTVINVMGIKQAIRAINVMTLFKILPVIVLILLSIPHLTPAGVLPTDFPTIDETGGIVLLILYAFIGFEGALVTAGETKNPKKTIPLALISTVIIITIIYFLVVLTYVNVVTDVGGDTPLVDMAEILMGPVGGVIIIVAAIFSILGNATSIIIAAPRMTYAMAEEGSLPKWFSKVHNKYNTPANSIVFLGVISFLLAISGTFVYLAVASTLSRMIAYGICMLALPRIRKKADAETLKNATKLPGGYLIPAIGFSVTVYAATQSTLLSWQYMAVFVAVGSLLYFINKKVSSSE